MLDYSWLLLKDKKDLTPEFLSHFPNAKTAGCYDKLDKVNADIKILSVKFSRVGAKTFKCYPNLKYIICRSHGIDNINLDLCNQHNVEVIASYPTTQFAAEYIIHYLKEINAQQLYLWFGYGNIAKEVIKLSHTESQTDYFVDSKTDLDCIQPVFPNVNTLIVTVPLCDKTCLIINKGLLKNFKGTIISIARSDVLNNKDLLDAIKIGNINYLVADCLNTKYRDELLATNKVTFTHHTAWNFNFNEQTYIQAVKQVIDKYA